MSPTLPRLLLLLLLLFTPGKLPPGPSEQRPQRALLSLPRALSAAGPQPLSRRGATVLGSICTHRPVCVPAAAVQYPRRYGQNFPATRHSRLSVCLADHEHAAEAHSCFALLPDSLMLHIACFCDEVLLTSSSCREANTEPLTNCAAAPRIPLASLRIIRPQSRA